MTRSRHPRRATVFSWLLVSVLGINVASQAQQAKTDPQKAPSLPDQTYMPVVVDQDFEAIYEADKQRKPDVMSPVSTVTRMATPTRRFT